MEYITRSRVNISAYNSRRRTNIYRRINVEIVKLFLTEMLMFYSNGKCIYDSYEEKRALVLRASIKRKEKKKESEREM